MAAEVELGKGVVDRPPANGSAPVGTVNRDLRECVASDDDMTIIFL